MATSFSFANTVKLLQDTGVYDYLLPFLLIFGIIFAVLEKTQVFGEGKSNINGLIAFVIGLILIAQQGIVEIINRFLPRVSLILVVILMAIVVVATLAGKRFEGFQGAWMGLFILVAIGAVIYSAAAGTGGSSFLSSQDQDTLLAIGIPVAILGVVMWFVTRSGRGDEDKPSSLKKALEGLAGSVK